MANPTPPKRPSRAVKQMPRESSGLLMSVIRTLSASESNEQRDREKAQLQKEYTKSNLELDKHISKQDESIKKVLQIFGDVSSRLSDSRERMRTIRENLVACKKLLHCKRDELKERWLEGVEHKHVMALLQQIDEVRDVGDKIGELMAERRHLEAARLLSSSLSTLHTHLQGIDALKQVHQDLLQAKESLYSDLVQTLHDQLYHSSSRGGLRRNGSSHASGAMARIGSDRGYRIPGARRNLGPDLLALDKTSATREEEEGEPPPLLPIIVECFALLGKLPEAVETMKERMQKEFTLIIQRVNRSVVSSNLAAESSSQPYTATTLQPETHQQPSMATARNGFIRIHSHDAKLMQELLQICCEELRSAVSGHEAVLASMRSSASQHNITLQLYTMADVWSKVQAGLQVLISQYVDLSQAGLLAPPNTNTGVSLDAAQPTDISAYFAKKSKPRTKNQQLFKFEASYHAITLNSYLLEQLGQQPSLDDAGDSSAGKKSLERVMVCQSSPHNITVLYNPLMSFIAEIELAMGYMPGEQCSLHVFVSELLRDVFLVRLHMDTARRQEQATKALDLWTTTHHSTYRVTSAQQGASASKPDLPLLQSSVLVWECLEELSVLMSSIPSSAHHFVSMMCNCLLNYRETCQAAYRGITQPDSEDKRVISATWAKDEDISRFLRDLPNWRQLATASDQRSREAMNSVSPDEVDERNRKEAQILMGSLGEQLIPQHEILSDTTHLRTLALLHQTMEWFGNSIVQLAATLSSTYGNTATDTSTYGNTGTEGGARPPPSLVPQAAIQTLTSLAQDFIELANTCLLVLHLEVRVHCFYYLLSVGRGVGVTGGKFAPSLDGQDPDPEVLALNKDLSTIDDALSQALPARKCKYIFEGLGPLICNIVTSWPTHIRRLNDNGIKKMCRNILSLQQQLTNITMTREVALDSARQYYELFYLTPQELLNQIVNRGPVFTELEYINALQLLHRSNPAAPAQSLQHHLQRLSEILGDVGVTV